MRIVTPDEIEKVAWEGYLEPVGDVYRSGALPKVTLGEPVWWVAEALEKETGKAWTVPADGKRYALVRLACTLHRPEQGSAFSDAKLTTYLRPAGSPGQAVAHDLYPMRETAERTGRVGARLGPDLKFGPVDASLAEASIEIDLRQVYPVVQAFGLGESNPYWTFERHKTHPLLGSQYVYAVVAAPPAASGVRLTIELVATVDTGWLPMRFKTPEQAEARISHLVPLPAAEGGDAPAGTPEGAASKEPDIAAVRALLQAAFSPSTLRIFCQDRAAFRPLLDRFSPNDGLADMAARVIDYCREEYLWDELLDEVKAASPRQWAMFEDRLEG